MSSQAERDKNTAHALGSLFSWFFLLALGCWGIVSVYGFFWGEQEGETKIDDCRNKIDLKEGSSGTWFKKFTCSYVKTKSGKVIRGKCVSVSTDGPVCQTSYMYIKDSEVHCTDPKFPYPGYDDMCHAEFY